MLLLQWGWGSLGFCSVFSDNFFVVRYTYLSLVLTIGFYYSQLIRGSWGPTFKFWRGSWGLTFKLWGESRVLRSWVPGSWSHFYTMLGLRCFLAFSYGTSCLARWAYWDWNFYDFRNRHMKFSLQHHPCKYKTFPLTPNSWLAVIVYQNLGNTVYIEVKTTLKASNIFHIKCKTKRWWNGQKHTLTIVMVTMWLRISELKWKFYMVWKNFASLPINPSLKSILLYLILDHLRLVKVS